MAVENGMKAVIQSNTKFRKNVVRSTRPTERKSI